MPGMQLVELGASVLRAAIEFDALEAQGLSASLATDTLRGREDCFAPEVIEALVAIRGAGAFREEVRELPLSGLRVGMTFVEDVKTASGTLFVARGYQNHAGFLERARNSRGAPSTSRFASSCRAPHERKNRVSPRGRPAAHPTAKKSRPPE